MPEAINQRPQAKMLQTLIKTLIFLPVFGIGSMIYSGIEIGMFFELTMDSSANCKNLFSVIRPILQMSFVFVQMYFIFLNQKMNIYKNKFMSRFGLMHMIATNLCVWLHVLILETSHEIMDAHIGQCTRLRALDYAHSLMRT
jgi:hypothetical protein